MNIVDIFIILFLLTAILRGLELGLIRQICSTAGLIAGFFLGVFIQGKLIHLAQTPGTKALLSLCVLIGAIAIFSSIGEYIGARLKGKLEKVKIQALNKLDKGAGSITAGATFLLIFWLAAQVFGNVPISGMQQQIQGSTIIAQLNKALPPAPQVVARLGHLIDPNSFPDVFTGLEPNIDTTSPLPSIGELDEAVQRARASVVKIEGKGCGGISDGSGFVADTNLVITNAHVVAGVQNPYVIDGGGRHPATVLWFDSELDMAVLKADKLAGKPLAMQMQAAKNGTPGATLGYPGGGEFAAHPATIVDSFIAVGRDIYNQNTTRRNVYSVKSDIEPGNSGGPLINKEGDVIGLVFAKSTTYEDVGYALTMEQVISGLNQAKDRSKAVGTGNCAQ